MTRGIGIIIVGILLSSCLDSSSGLRGQPSPQPYKCGDVGGFSHCYAIGGIGDHLTGFRTSIDVVTHFIGGNGFINNEFWLVNYGPAGGWLEVGYQANRVELPKYFWAVLDPDTQIYTQHDIGTIPHEEFGTRVTFDIHQTEDNTFLISVDGTFTHYSTTVVVHLWDQRYGGSVHLGQELAGTQGAQASLSTFVDNQIYDDTFHRRFSTEDDWKRAAYITTPYEAADKPPYGGWIQPPQKSQEPREGNRGGAFTTYCCAP